MPPFVGRLLMAWLAAGALVPFAQAQERKLAPADEAVGDMSWAYFKNRLLDAVMKRDRKFVLSILDPDVRVGIDGARGILLGMTGGPDLSLVEVPVGRMPRPRFFAQLRPPEKYRR